MGLVKAVIPLAREPKGICCHKIVAIKFLKIKELKFF